MGHPLRPSGAAALSVEKHAAPTQPQWPSFIGAAAFVGTSPSGKVNVWYDPPLGAPGLANAQALVTDADRVRAIDRSIFGVDPGPVNVLIFALGGRTDGTGGADHMGCTFSDGADIEVCAAFGRPDRVSALFEAELSECQMRGNLCGLSTGEGLSRWCAAVVNINNALADFASAPAWQRAGMPNWVDRTEATDQGELSTGCCMAFISWLLSLDYSLPQIAQAMVALGDGGTLAALYTRLTGGRADAWARFVAAIHALPHGIVDDDPFKGTHPPSPPPPPPPPASGRLFGLTFTAPVRQGGRITFAAPVPVPAGSYDVVRSTSHAIVDSDN